MVALRLNNQSLNVLFLYIECLVTAVGLSSGSRSDLFDAVFVDAPASAGSRVTLRRFEESFEITGGQVSAQETRFGAPPHGHAWTVGFAETTAPFGTRQENVPSNISK